LLPREELDQKWGWQNAQPIWGWGDTWALISVGEPLIPCRPDVCLVPPFSFCIWLNILFSILFFPHFS
jgi:hypothetical protein